MGGAQGEGPGELQTLGPLFRANLPNEDRAHVGVIDWQLNRAVVFTIADGAVVGEFAVPFLFRPVAPLKGGTLLGLYETPGDEMGALAEVDLQGSVLRRVVLNAPALPDSGKSARFIRGHMLASGDLVVQIQGNHFGLYSTDGVLRDTFSSPKASHQQLRSERDVDDYVQGMGSTFGPPSQQQVEQYRSSAPPPIIQETSLRIGPEETLWMATRREDERSFLSVFRDGELLGEVQVRHRLLGFDVWNDLLVTLVERPNRDDQGMYVRGIDWYNIRSGNSVDSDEDM
jgi:hypothetical protein